MHVPSRCNTFLLYSRLKPFRNPFTYSVPWVMRMKVSAFTRSSNSQNAKRRCEWPRRSAMMRTCVGCTPDTNKMPPLSCAEKATWEALQGTGR